MPVDLIAILEWVAKGSLASLMGGALYAGATGKWMWRKQYDDMKDLMERTIARQDKTIEELKQENKELRALSLHVSHLADSAVKTTAAVVSSTAPTV